MTKYNFSAIDLATKTLTLAILGANLVRSQHIDDEFFNATSTEGSHANKYKSGPESAIALAVIISTVIGLGIAANGKLRRRISAGCMNVQENNQLDHDPLDLQNLQQVVFNPDQEVEAPDNLEWDNLLYRNMAEIAPQPLIQNREFNHREARNSESTVPDSDEDRPELSPTPITSGDNRFTPINLSNNNSGKNTPSF